MMEHTVMKLLMIIRFVDGNSMRGIKENLNEVEIIKDYLNLIPTKIIANKKKCYRSCDKEFT